MQTCAVRLARSEVNRAIFFEDSLCLLHGLLSERRAGDRQGGTKEMMQHRLAYLRVISLVASVGCRSKQLPHPDRA